MSGAAPRPPVLGAARRRWGEEAIRVGLFAAAIISVLTTLGILASLLGETIKFFQDVGVGAFITDGDWKPLFSDPQFGIWPLINGTLLVTGIAVLVAIPVGLGSAIYLAEYASPRARRVVKPVLEVLVGVPTVVLGFFALTFVTPTLLNDVLGLNVGVFNALSAGVVMGIMIVPTIASVSEDAMSAVPEASARDRSASAPRSSRPRPGSSSRRRSPDRGRHRARRLTRHRRDDDRADRRRPGPNKGSIRRPRSRPSPRSSAPPRRATTPPGTVGYYSIFACGMTLFVLTLIMNAIAIRFVRKYRQAYE